MEFLSQYGLFLAETVTIVLAIIAIVVFFVMLSTDESPNDFGKNH
ncbi:hypothetical protein [Morganella morganii]